jgi:hypothetical protein
MVDESFDRVADDGLDGGVQLLREHLDNALSALGAPEMGRQPGSPDMVAFYICEAATLAICAIAMVICLAAAFCWCCLWWAIYLACSINLGACAALAFV